MSKPFKPQRKQTPIELLPIKKKKKKSQGIREGHEGHEGLKDLILLAISVYPYFGIWYSFRAQLLGSCKPVN